MIKYKFAHTYGCIVGCDVQQASQKMYACAGMTMPQEGQTPRSPFGPATDYNDLCM